MRIQFSGYVIEEKRQQGVEKPKTRPSRLATLTLARNGIGRPPMKEGIHPEYREVVFMDVQTGDKFVTRSTVGTRETVELDGKTYPLFKCDVTSKSHPFYTGAQTRIVETGRVEKFRARFARTTGAAKA